MDNVKAVFKQSCLSDLPALFAVLLLPFMMAVLANGKEGVILGLLILVFFIYWIIVIYNKLYRKTLIVEDDKITFINKEYFKSYSKNINFKNIKSLKVSKTLINNLTNTGKVILTTKEDEVIEMINTVNADKLPLLIKEL